MFKKHYLALFYFSSSDFNSETKFFPMSSLQQSTTHQQTKETEIESNKQL
jgi:hypothetical protein